MSSLTYQDVLDILRLVDSGSFSDFQIEFEGTKVKVTRPTGAETSVVRPRTGAASPIVRPVEHPKAGISAGDHARPQMKEQGKSVLQPAGARPPVTFSNGVDVKPPMAGTFYCAAAPGAPPYVEINSVVKKGDQLGMVEVMKLFTAVHSPCDGIVRLILVGNEEFVNNDQTLMIIEAAQ